MRLKFPLFFVIVFLLGCSDDEVETPPKAGIGDLEVYVHFEDQPYPEAMVTIVSEKKTLIADSTGTVIFKNLKEAEYNIEVILPNFLDSPYKANGTVIDNQKILVDVAVDIYPPPPLVNNSNTLDIGIFLDSVYLRLGNIFGFDKFVQYWGDIGTDVVYIDPSISSSYAFETLDRYDIFTDDQVIYNAYTSHYRLILEANSGLDRIKSGEHAPISEADKKVVEAEFRFLRAIAYFNLIKIYGQPPVFTTINIVIDDPLDVPQDANATYTLIEKDLIFAKENLLGSSSNTKASKGAAQALLGKVYMQMAGFPMLQTDKYALALEEFNALEGSYTLRMEYADVFQEDSTTMNGEVFFSVDVSKGQSDTEGRYGSTWGPLGWADYDGLLLAPGFLESYTNGQIIFDETLTFPLDITDQRFEYNIATFVFDGETQETTEIQDWRPFKFMPKSELAGGVDNVPVNFPYLRYSDILLLKAEAENEVNGPTPSAYDAINTVRRRAFKNAENDLPLGLDKQQFFEAVFKERKLELCFEGIRKDDLVRWQLLEQVVEEFNATDLDFKKNYQPHEYIWPIPQQEIDINSFLKQNPGY